MQGCPRNRGFRYFWILATFAVAGNITLPLQRWGGAAKTNERLVNATLSRNISIHRDRCYDQQSRFEFIKPELAQIISRRCHRRICSGPMTPSQVRWGRLT